MTRNTNERTERLAADIRRQFGAEATTRFLRALPAFGAESAIPDRFRDLLDRLDGAEMLSMSDGRR